MKKRTPQTFDDVRKKIAEIERQRAEDYQWLLEETLKNVDQIATDRANRVLVTQRQITLVHKPRWKFWQR